jgi:hypothetical protein
VVDFEFHSQPRGGPSFSGGQRFWSKLNLPGIHVLEPSPAEPRPLFARARPAFNPNCLIVADDLKVMPELLEPEVLGDMKN